MILSSVLPVGILVLERDPPSVSHFFAYLQTWLQDAGGFAALGLLILLLGTMGTQLVGGFLGGATAEPHDRRALGPLPFWVQLLGGVALVVCATSAVLTLLDNQPEPAPTAPGALPPPAPPPTALGLAAGFCLTVGGALALLAVALPFLQDLPRFRFRRIWALAQLSFTEARRRKVLWVFMAFLLVFLFPPKWFFPIKPEDEVRTNVTVIYWAMTPLLLVTAGLWAAFSIPSDIRSQTLHTVVTKPVERFEIVLGRFLGFSFLASLILLVLTGFSLVLIWASRVAPEAEEESFKARVPLYGTLQFRDIRKPAEEFKGESVGREWEYRKYIAGGERSPFRAVWLFGDRDLRTPLFSKSLTDLPAVRCEFAFDIFRTTKGVEGQAVNCTFYFVSGQGPDPNRLAEYQKKVAGELPIDGQKAAVNAYAQPGSSDPVEQADWKKLDALAAEYGYYEYKSKPVADYHTEWIYVPTGLFRHAAQNPPAADASGNPGPRVQVSVRCDSRTQFLGVARRDLYLMAGEEPFGWNFFKGAAGLWMRLCLVIGLAVTLSTYLTGVVAWLGAMFIFLAGLFKEFIENLAMGMNVGGGPAESAVRLFRNENLTTQLDPTPVAQTAGALDIAFRWGMRRWLGLIPDVDRYSWSNYVAEGFNIDMGDLLMTALFLVGYLLPWLLLGYYLMKSREIASS